MELQFFGANCVSVSYKSTRVVIDDNLAVLGKKSITKSEDVALFTNEVSDKTNARIVFNGPGEYEVGAISVIGIDAIPFMNDDSGKKATMYKLFNNDLSVLVTGHILGELNSAQLEKIGAVDVLFVPVGNGGYTLDPIGAQKLVKDIEPKLVIPTHYDGAGINYPINQSSLEDAIKELAIEPRETVSKLKIKSIDLAELTQLEVLEIS